MTASTARASRRRSVAIADQVTYCPLARSVMTAGLHLAVSNPGALVRIRPFADWMIARASAVVPGTRVQTVPGPPRGEWVWAPGAGGGTEVLLVLHGSGYLICSARTHRGFASHLSRYRAYNVRTDEEHRTRLTAEHRRRVAVSLGEPVAAAQRQRRGWRGARTSIRLPARWRYSPGGSRSWSI